MFNGPENYKNSLTTIILSILFPLARWATTEMPSNSPPKFPIATGEWATAKRTPCEDTNKMEEIEDHSHIKTRKRLCDTLKLPANIPSVPP